MAWKAVLHQIIIASQLYHPSWIYRFSHATYLLLHFLLCLHPCFQLVSSTRICDYLHILACICNDLGQRHQCTHQSTQFENAMKFPKLYHSLQSKNYLSIFNFLVWLWKACFQATIIIILTLVIFK